MKQRKKEKYPHYLQNKYITNSEKYKKTIWLTLAKLGFFGLDEFDKKRIFHITMNTSHFFWWIS